MCPIRNISLLHGNVLGAMTLVTTESDPDLRRYGPLLLMAAHPKQHPRPSVSGCMVQITTGPHSPQPRIPISPFPDPKCLPGSRFEGYCEMQAGRNPRLDRVLIWTIPLPSPESDSPRQVTTSSPLKLGKARLWCSPRALRRCLRQGMGCLEIRPYPVIKCRRPLDFLRPQQSEGMTLIALFQLQQKASILR